MESSHTLISWDKVKYLRELKDYGYGVNYDWSYGLNSRYFFDYSVQQVEVTTQVKVVVTDKTDKTDLLCTYWDDDKCLSCSGDYYANNLGRCVRVDD